MSEHANHSQVARLPPDNTSGVAAAASEACESDPKTGMASPRSGVGGTASSTASISNVNKELHELHSMLDSVLSHRQASWNTLNTTFGRNHSSFAGVHPPDSGDNVVEVAQTGQIQDEARYVESEHASDAGRSRHEKSNGRQGEGDHECDDGDARGAHTGGGTVTGTASGSPSVQGQPHHHTRSATTERLSPHVCGGADVEIQVSAAERCAYLMCVCLRARVCVCVCVYA